MKNCMSTDRTLYRLFDPPCEFNPGCHLVENWAQADEWCKNKWGIFWTVNSFDGPRKKENLKKILAWAADIDEGTKDQQRELIKKYPTPSCVVETKRGYQLYFDALDATVENHKEIQERLVFVYGADANAKDLSRILRVPAYLHWKDPENPFAIKLVSWSDKKYTEKTMLKFFIQPKEEIKFEQKNQVRKELSFLKNDNVFDRIYSMDCEQALMRLSGSGYVGGEIYSFKNTSSGNLNLLVNGKSTSCFLDRNKRIGSSDKGGPTCAQWLKWYSGSYKEAMRVMREVFPEIFIDEKKK